MNDYTGGMTPLTAWDLREIAKVVTKAERAFGDTNDGTETALSKPLDNIKLDVMRPGGGDDIVGHITYCDGWLGFVPLGPRPAASLGLGGESDGE